MKSSISNKLSNKGYIIIKDEYTDKEIKNIKDTLSVSPYSPYQSKFSPPPSFPIYQESIRKLYLPRYWALENLGQPKKFNINQGTNINIKFNGGLRPIQEEAVSVFMKNCYPEYGGGILCLGCGQGKSLAKNTPVIMYNGTIKMIQDVKIGDQLMGDDSTPRNVINLGRGMEMMYDIIPTKGDTYTVNESHILSLKCSTNHGQFKKENVYDIPLKDYINLPNSYNGRGGILLGYRVGVDFSFKKVDIDPYFLGYWLGDENYFAKDKKTQNTLLDVLNKYNLINNKHIPHNYKCNSREIRLQVLAGFIDSDGSVSNNEYVIIQKNETLLDDIIYLARSLGFACYKKIGTFYRTCIHGKGLEEIPVKCEHKKIQPGKTIT